MEQKRYQVFVSSTFTDLPEERQAVFQALLRMKCIPAGMELFGAVDDTIFEYITKVIDTCDYYLVIVGGRYGAPTADGISYTEKEYDYAVNVRKLRVIGLLHRKPDELPVSRSELDPEARRRLEAFRKKVADNRLVAHWESVHELKAEAALAMATALDMFPAVGWVRADAVANVDMLAELNELRKEVESLRKANLTSPPAFPDIAGPDEQIGIDGTVQGGFAKTHWWHLVISWRRLLAVLLPIVMHPLPEDEFRSRAAKILFRRSGVQGGWDPIDIVDESFHTIQVQLLALRAVEVSADGGSAVWKLTDLGRHMMFEARTIRTFTKAATLDANEASAANELSAADNDNANSSESDPGSGPPDESGRS